MSRFKIRLSLTTLDRQSTMETTTLTYSLNIRYQAPLYSPCVCHLSDQRQTLISTFYSSQVVVRRLSSLSRVRVDRRDRDEIVSRRGLRIPGRQREEKILVHTLSGFLTPISDETTIRQTQINSQ